LRIIRNLFDGRGHVVVALAFCLAFAGTAAAAKLITGEQVKNGSLTGKDVKDRSLTARDFKGSVKGERGAQGPRGSQGPQGSQGLQGTPGEPGSPGGALAYAKVNFTGTQAEPTYTLVPERSKNINAVNRTGNPANPATAIPGIVCVDVSVPVNVAVASTDRVPVDPSVIASVQVPTVNGADRCPAGSDAAILLKNSNDVPTESGFYVIFN